MYRWQLVEQIDGKKDRRVDRQYDRQIVIRQQDRYIDGLRNSELNLYAESSKIFLS